MPRSACEPGQYLFPKFAKMLNLGNRCIGMVIAIYLEMRIDRAEAGIRATN